MSPAPSPMRALRLLTCMMFLMFALTTDSVGVIIPAVIREFGLSLTQASAFHYTTMAAMAGAGFFLGFLADRLGHKRTIVLGLSIFTLNSALFLLGRSYATFLCLLFVSGISIGIFRTGAMSLIGDLSADNRAHTRLMNAVEGFFGVGAIIGPAIVGALLGRGVSWRWLYGIAGILCAVLLVIASRARFPGRGHGGGGDGGAGEGGAARAPVTMGGTLRMLGNPWAMGFSAALFLYVAVECSIYVWMPTLLAGYHGRLDLVAGYALSAFFILRAAGRFVGSWALGHLEWTAVTALFGTAILACFGGSLLLGVSGSVVLLPLTGVFMSVLYPTLNSKAMSCFPRAQHGTIAGIILFFSCAAAALGPYAMGRVSDAGGGPGAGFVLATAFAALLAAGLVLNWIFKPTRGRLRALDAGGDAP